MKRNRPGHRAGEMHPRAELSDDEVRRMREAREKRGLTYGQVCRLFRCSYWTARDILAYRTRVTA